MSETLFEELKRYVGFGPPDEQVLRSLHPLLSPDFPAIASVFYQRILDHDGARTALVEGESQVGRLKVTLIQWMDRLFTGPYDQAYFDLRARIGRVHVRIALPQHYMFGAMNIVRQELNARVDRHFHSELQRLNQARTAISKLLDLELAIMLHTYREDLLSQKAKSERLSTFGQLVGSIGHELRNPLGVIETSLFILKSRPGLDERAVKHVDRIGDQLRIANDIITQLLDMIRDRPLSRESVSLAAVVADALGVVARPEGVVVQLEGLERLPAISGDPVQIRQVFVNLLENGVHACGETGAITVRGAQVGDRVSLTVEDSGPGVDESIQARLFEPLVTTKDKGIGLGLALVRRIVERHGGSIGYARGQGGGAAFTLLFPRNE